MEDFFNKLLLYKFKNIKKTIIINELNRFLG